jgi:hypothetical protein
MQGKTDRLSDFTPQQRLKIRDARNFTKGMRFCAMQYRHFSGAVSVRVPS